MHALRYSTRDAFIREDYLARRAGGVDAVAIPPHDRQLRPPRRRFAAAKAASLDARRCRHFVSRRYARRRKVERRPAHATVAGHLMTPQRDENFARASTTARAARRCGAWRHTTHARIIRSTGESSTTMILIFYALMRNEFGGTLRCMMPFADDASGTCTLLMREVLTAVLRMPPRTHESKWLAKIGDVLRHEADARGGAMMPQHYMPPARRHNAASRYSLLMSQPTI